MPSQNTTKKKGNIAWTIPPELRHGLNSHAEYLSVENETATDEMVVVWLKERLAIEEKKRALKTLGLEENDLSSMHKRK